LNPTRIDRFLLGDNPFLGVDHLSQERARQKQRKEKSPTIPTVMKAAFESGAEGVTFSTHPIMYNAFKQLKEEEYDDTFGLYPVVPAADVYVREAAQKGMAGLLIEILSRINFSEKARVIIRGGLSVMSSDPMRMLKTFLDTEIASFLNVSPKNAELRTVFLHEIISDVALGFQMTDFLTAIVSHINDRYEVKAGFVTRNFARFVDFINSTGISQHDIAIMTPFNKIGFQMIPSKEQCEITLGKIAECNSIIAMSTLAAGLIGVRESVEYLKSKVRLDSFTVGVSSVDHAKSTFGLFTQELRSRR
jgi:hypothetical protein